MERTLVLSHQLQWSELWGLNTNVPVKELYPAQCGTTGAPNLPNLLTPKMLQHPQIGLMVQGRCGVPSCGQQQNYRRKLHHTYNNESIHTSIHLLPPCRVVGRGWSLTGRVHAGQVARSSQCCQRQTTTHTLTYTLMGNLKSLDCGRKLPEGTHIDTGTNSTQKGSGLDSNPGISYWGDGANHSRLHNFTAICGSIRNKSY